MTTSTRPRTCPHGALIEPDGWTPCGVCAGAAVGGDAPAFEDGTPVPTEPDDVARENAPTRPPLLQRLMSVVDLAAIPPVAPLVDGLLYRGTLAQLSGPPGSFKSFVMVAWALSIALGRPFGPHRVPHAGPVVIVAAEGASGLRARILAWCEMAGIDPADTVGRLHVLPAPVQIGNRVDITDALNAVDALGAVLLALDTRARCTVGLEENSAREQGMAIAGADRIVNGGCTVLVVHHSGRSGGPRGSTAWDGAVWSDLRVVGEGLTATLACHKHKDVADGCEHRYRLVPYTVDETLMPRLAGQSDDDWIAARSTLVASPIVDHESRTPSGETGRLIRDIVRDAAGPHGLTRAELRDIALEKGATRSRAYEAINALLRDGAIVDVGGGKTERLRLAPPRSTTFDEQDTAS